MVERCPQGILRQVHVHEQMKIKPRELERAREKAGIDVWMREREKQRDRERKTTVRQTGRQTDTQADPGFGESQNTESPP